MPFVCRCCGELHESLPEPAYRRPDEVRMYERVGESARIEGNDDHCILRGRTPAQATRHYLRGVIRFRVVDAGNDEGWAIGAWVEVSGEDFAAYRALDDAGLDGSATPRFAGRIANGVLGLPGMLGAEVAVQPGPADKRPRLWFPAGADHLLARLQRDGIDMPQIHAFVGQIH